MGIENNFKSFRQETFKYNTSQSNKKGAIMSYEDAYDIILNEDILKEKLSEDIDVRLEDRNNSKTVIKDKEYFRQLKRTYISKITEIVVKLNLKVRGYEDITKFIINVVEDMIGFSSLKELMYDDKVTDIFCLSWNKIFYESSEYKVPVKFKHKFTSQKHYRDFIERLLREAGKTMLDSGENKVIDFDLYGDRYNAISTSVAPNDLVITIRKHSEDHIKLDQIIKYNCINQEYADLIGTLILGECNIIVAGVTGSGKTTSMRAFLDYYVSKVNKRMLVCEDTRELFPENDHTLELVTSKGVDENTTISLRDLIILALRQKPKYIVVGEVRGPEAEAAVEAMATGHSTLFSMHSGTPIDAVNRLVTKYLMQMPSLGIDVVERIIGSALDYIIIQDDIPGIGRKITSLTEVTYDYTEKRVKLRTIVQFDFRKKDFVLKNKLSQEKADKMLRKGITIETLNEYTDWDWDKQ